MTHALVAQNYPQLLFIEQSQGPSDRLLVDAELTRQAPQVDRNRSCHEEAGEYGMTVCSRHTLCAVAGGWHAGT